jgi:uncharacterized protein (DUF1501 family)
MTRRNFIKLSSFTAMALSPMARIGMGLTAGSTMALANSSFNDYKALVVLYLDGGNDAMSMFPPTTAADGSTTTAHDHYNAIREDGQYNSLNIANVDLSDEVANNFTTDVNGYYTNTTEADHPYYDAPQVGDAKSESAGRSYRKGSYFAKADSGAGANTGLGINSMMPELASMYNSGKVALVSNVGTLVRPTTQAQINAGTAELPVFLFAHNHQKRATFTAQAEQLADTGWAGRIADAWKVNDPVGLNLSYDGANRMLIGSETSPLVMPTTTPVSFTTNYNALKQKGDYFESLINRFHSISKSNAFESYYTNRIKLAGDLSTILLESLAQAPDFSTFSSKNTYGQNLFTVPDMEHDIKLLTHDETRDRIFAQFEAAAKMIKVGKDILNHPRQIIFVRMPNFDTHQHQTANHFNNIRSLSLAVSDFQKALEEMNLDDQVLTVSMSDFGRTLKNSGDGTDHGWGGHSFIITGDSNFNGGNVFGTVMDDLRLDGPNTYTEKGRIIPTTSIEQMLAPCLKWFGVSEALMPTILPNLANFDADPNTANLAGLFTAS